MLHSRCGFKEQFSDVIVVTDFRRLWIVFLKRMAADVTVCRNVILFALLGTHLLYRPIRLELLHGSRLPLDEHQTFAMY